MFCNSGSRLATSFGARKARLRRGEFQLCHKFSPIAMKLCQFLDISPPVNIKLRHVDALFVLCSLAVFACRFSSISLDHCSSQSTLKAWTSTTVTCAQSVSVAAGTSLSGTRHDFLFYILFLFYCFSVKRIEERIHDLRLQYRIPTATIAGTIGQNLHFRSLAFCYRWCKITELFPISAG